MRLAGTMGQGIEATLVELYSIPFDGDAIVTLGQENHGRMLTLEDNYGSGFGSAVADALVEYGGLLTVKQMCAANSQIRPYIGCHPASSEAICGRYCKNRRQHIGDYAE